MPQPQLLSVLLVAGMMVTFFWGRLRCDIVAMLALLAAVARSRIIERPFSRLGSGTASTHWQVPLLVFSVAILSAIIKNIGAACDVLTPIGHQCNTLVMGPGGYRFGDYARLGAPLSLIVILLAVPMILLVWPLR